MVFKNIKIGYNKWINIIASASFGVYLIHDNNIVRPFLWKTVFKNSTYQNTVLLIPYSICVVCIVYLVSTIIDLLRQGTAERVFITVVNGKIERIRKPCETVISFCKKAVFGI